MSKRIGMRLTAVALAIFAGCGLLYGQEFSVSTNVLDYVNLGTLNLEASVGVAQHWSVNAGLKYNPFTFDGGEKDIRNRQRSYSAGARYWPWHVYSGWWLSGKLRYQEYNSGGFISPETSEGDRFGGGFSGGYTYMVNPHLNVDMGFGMWAGYDSYITYACQTCGRVIGKGGKYFVLPADIVISLSYIF